MTSAEFRRPVPSCRRCRRGSVHLRVEPLGARLANEDVGLLDHLGCPAAGSAFSFHHSSCCSASIRIIWLKSLVVVSLPAPISCWKIPISSSVVGKAASPRPPGSGSSATTSALGTSSRGAALGDPPARREHEPLELEDAPLRLDQPLVGQAGADRRRRVVGPPLDVRPRTRPGRLTAVTITRTGTAGREDGPEVHGRRRR